MKYNKHKRNVIQKTGLGYSRVFLNNKKTKGKYIIIHDEGTTFLETGQNVTGDVRRDGSIEACITVDGKKIRLHDYLMRPKTEQKELVDHINHETRDLRLCNLRIGTPLLNKMNTPTGIGTVIKLSDGKYGLRFPPELGVDTSGLVYDTKECAKKGKQEILEKLDECREWTYGCSQKIAKEIETYEFAPDDYVDSWSNTGTLGEILNLSPENDLNNRLRNMIVNSKGGRFPPDVEWRNEIRLKYDYQKWLEQQENVT